MFLKLVLTISRFYSCNSTSEYTTFKIAEGVDKNTEYSNVDNEYIQPHNPSGPISLFYLNGVCFSKTIDRYEYKVCPFQNVTQMRQGSSRPTLIGVWGYWATGIPGISRTSSSSSTPIHDINMSFSHVMKYSDGQTCGSKEKSATINIICDYISDDFEIINVIEEGQQPQCEYNIDFGIPLPCSLLTFPPQSLSSSHQNPDISTLTSIKSAEISSYDININSSSSNATINGLPLDTLGSSLGNSTTTTSIQQVLNETNVINSNVNTMEISSNTIDTILKSIEDLKLKLQDLKSAQLNL